MTIVSLVSLGPRGGSCQYRINCPGTAATADILQAVDALAVYAVDTLMIAAVRHWNYRRYTMVLLTVDHSCRHAEGAAYVRWRSMKIDQIEGASAIARVSVTSECLGKTPRKYSPFCGLTPGFRLRRSRAH